MIALLAALFVFLPFAGMATVVERAERTGSRSFGTWRS